MLVGRSDATAVAETSVAAAAVVTVFAPAAADVVDGCTTMEAFACKRVRIVSTGWMARVEIPPEIQPAVKSTQDDSLAMLLLIIIAGAGYLCSIITANHVCKKNL